MMCLLGTWILVLELVAWMWAVQASVIDNFKDCNKFFMRTPSEGFLGSNLHQICQHYDDKPRFITLYDSNHRTPIYSAYTFKKSHGQARMDKPWMYEPQLASKEENSNMRMLPPESEMDPLIEESQAVLQDFTNAVIYERGALNPDQHQFNSGNKAATYTLTNHVPLVIAFLEESWVPYVDIVRQRLNNFCWGMAYMVTGIIISGTMIYWANAARLAIPRYMWSAYCCPHFDRNSPYDIYYMLPTFAAYGLNQQLGHSVIEVPLKTLENLLRTQTNMDRNLALLNNTVLVGR